MFKPLSIKIRKALNRAAPGLYLKEQLGEVVDGIGRRTNLRKVLVAGAAAGALTVPGVAVGDELAWVTRYNAGTPTDLSAEFSITDTNAVSNAGGTATTGSTLEFVFFDLTV